MASLEKAIEIHFPAEVRSLSPDSLASLSQDQRFAYAKVREFFLTKNQERGFITYTPEVIFSLGR